MNPEPERLRETVLVLTWHGSTEQMRKDYKRWAKNPTATRAAASRALYQYQGARLLIAREIWNRFRKMPVNPTTGPRNLFELHAAVRKELHDIRNELNRMLTGCVNAVRTTQSKPPSVAAWQDEWTPAIASCRRLRERKGLGRR